MFHNDYNLVIKEFKKIFPNEKTSFIKKDIFNCIEISKELFLSVSFQEWYRYEFYGKIIPTYKLPSWIFIAKTKIEL